MAIGTIGLVALARQATSASGVALRPPGAISDGDFEAACVRCGLCVRDCPYDILKLSGLTGPVAAGSPYFEARKGPCEMCEDIPCVVACPTGALDQKLTDIAEARMGTAVLVGHETCLNYLGLRCDVCYRVCPLIGEAIRLEQSANLRTGKHALFIPVVDTTKCTGCGKCERACVLDEAAIKVLPSEVAYVKSDEHYRLGWEEKRKKGEALIQDIIDLPDRGYDGGYVPEPVLPEKTPGGGYKGFKP